MQKRCLQFLSPLIFLLPSIAHGDVNWSGNITNASNVTNENLHIQSDVTFTGASPIKIEINDGGSYEATLDSNLFIEGNGSTHPLNIVLTNGTFKFIIDKTLTFKGMHAKQFFLSVSGPGTLIFEILGDRKLKFGNGFDPGAYFYTVMGGIGATPTVEFSRTGDVNDNVEVVVERDSAIGFMANTQIIDGKCPVSFEKGVLRFKVGNGGDGRFVLNIKNRGAVIVSGVLNKNGNQPNLNDLDRGIPAGRKAVIEIVNNERNLKNAGSLLVVNENKKFSRLLSNPFAEGTQYTGDLYGFIISVNGVVRVGNCAYLDYVGTQGNSQPQVAQGIIIDKDIQSCIRERNASAMIIDGLEESRCGCNAKLKLNGTSAAYFRSGVDIEGEVRKFDISAKGKEIFSFKCDRLKFNKFGKCFGNIVLDVEGRFDVKGNKEHNTAINILSLVVQPTGGTVVVGDKKKLFPLRTFERDMDDKLERYNKADFFINNRMNLIETTLKHDDRNHKVYEKNSPRESEPTYIGGESHLLFHADDVLMGCDRDSQRPRIVLLNSKIDFNESAAFAGVDIFVPNIVDCGKKCGLKEITREFETEDLTAGFNNFMHRKSTCKCKAIDNKSILKFFNNGRCLDNGTGRQLNLGTNLFCDCVCLGLFDCSAHLDIMQEFCQDKKTEQVLSLKTAQNDATVRQELADFDIKGQCSIHTIYLGCSSNISIGTDGDMGIDPCGMMFNLTTKPTLSIAGAFFSFDTQGGPERLPELGGSTGTGAIFVDNNGVFKTENKIANISTMVVKSGNAVLDIPAEDVYFHQRVGITDWQLDLSDEDQRVIVKPGEHYSNYTLDWINVCKDVCDSVTCFELYDPKMVPQCECDHITVCNLTALPTIKGEVDQFQVKRSRIGDQVELLVDGTDSCNAFIRELVFLTGWDSAEAPVGVIVLKGNARVGLGSLNRYVDSAETNTALGINGITLVPDGNGTININQDLIINNMCHILPGPNFGKNPETGEDELQTLTFCASDPRTVVVKSTGVLDLSQLNSFQRVAFAGQAALVLEPGARIRFSKDPSVRGNLLFGDVAEMRFTCGELPCPLLDVPNVTATDVLRVKVSGTGNIEFRASSQMILESNGFLGIESDPVCSPITDILLQARDNASLLIGPDGQLGGTLQVGNTAPVVGGDVKFELRIDGLGANLQLNSEGFLGLGAGIVRKPSGAGSSPSQTRIGALHQVSNVTINLVEGTFQHNIIETSRTSVDQDERPAATMVIGPVANGYRYIIQYTLDVRVLGGGNIINIGANVSDVFADVDEIDGLISGSVAAGTQVQVGTLAALNLFLDNGQPGGIKNQVFPNGITALPRPSVDVSGLTDDVFYRIIKTPEIQSMQQSRGNVDIESLDTSGLNFVFNGAIVRDIITKVVGSLGVQFKSSEAYDRGFVGLTVNDNGTWSTPTLIVGV